MAAHVSPAFRVDIGDVVTVGGLLLLIDIGRKVMIYPRAMSTTIEDGSVQCTAGVEEQGCDKGV